jgi:hypothetical protein
MSSQQHALCLSGLDTLGRACRGPRRPCCPTALVPHEPEVLHAITAHRVDQVDGLTRGLMTVDMSPVTLLGLRMANRTGRLLAAALIVATVFTGSSLVYLGSLAQ